MGKNVEGKFILHFPGQSYIYDICILEKELQKCCELALKNNLQISEVLLKKEDHSLIGIANNKIWGFANSLVLHLYNNWTFRQQISMINHDEIDLDDATQVLSEVFHCLSAKKKVDTSDISTLVKETLPAFESFETAMCK